MFTPNFSTSSISAVVPVLPEGVYAGNLANVSIVGKENKQYFNIQKAQSWNKDIGKMEDVLENGLPKYILSGMILMQVKLTSKKAQNILGRDEPSFIKMLNVRFTDNLELDKDKNQQFRTLIDAVGLSSEPFESYVTFEYDPDVEVPTELKDVPNIVDMLNALNYYKDLFNVICNACKDQNVKVAITKVTKADTTTENQIGGGRTSAGVLTYVEGCEDDVIEG